MLPAMADVLTYLRGLKPQNLVGAAFGSYGWSGEAVRQIEDVLCGMKVEMAGEGIRVKNVPDEGILARCYELGIGMAQKVNERLAPG
jgi:flavorubredoxin